MAALDWTTKDTNTKAAPTAPDGNGLDDHRRTLALKEHRDRDAAAVGRLERDVIPSLERELADLESKNALREPPKLQIATSTSGVLKVSQCLPVLVDYNDAIDHQSVAAGTIITVGTETDAQSLKVSNPGRRVVRVSLATLRERRSANHVA